MEYRLKVKQIKKAMRKNKYIILRGMDGQKYAINCGILRLRESLIHGAKNNKRSPYVSWYACDLNEYITYKAPFL